MDAYEIAVLEWLRKQREPVTTVEIQQAFVTLSCTTLRGVLKSLETQNKVAQATPRGLMQTWQARKS